MGFYWLLLYDAVVLALLLGFVLIVLLCSL